VIVVDYDGVNRATLVTGEASPGKTSAAHYNNFIKRLASKYDDRFVQ
jgi:hypothetical protein